MVQLEIHPQPIFAPTPVTQRIEAALPLCPTDLVPEAVVASDDSLLQVSDLEIQKAMRDLYSTSDMSALLTRISAIAEARLQYGDRSAMGLGGSRTCQDLGNAVSLMDWMHEHEIKRLHQIKLSLPSTGEEILAARERIQQRIASRRRGVAR